MTFLTFLTLQLNRLTLKPEAHALGPKKPTLTQLELSKLGKSGKK